MNINVRKILLWIFLGVLVVAALIVFGKFPGRTVPVLMYHHITTNRVENKLELSRKTFLKQMAFLKENNYRVIDPDQLIQILQGKMATGKEVVLTFDDGNLDNYENAIPVLDQYGYKGTFFIVYDWVGNPGYMNWDQLRDVVLRGHTVGSHTLSHPFLTEISIAKAKEEIYNSKVLIQKW